MRILSLEQVKKALDFNQIAVWIPEETMVDVVGAVRHRSLVKFDSPLCEVLVPAVDIWRDQGYDNLVRVFTSWRSGQILSLAKTNVAFPPDLVDAASPLIEGQAQAYRLLVEPGGLGKAGCGKERNLRTDRWVSHRPVLLCDRKCGDILSRFVPIRQKMW